MTAGEALAYITLAFAIGVVLGGCINAAVRRGRKPPSRDGHSDTDRAGRPPSTWIEHG
jgi:hypothetical protein